MSNRVYFYCSDFARLPDDESQDFDDFAESSGIEYEASYAIPLFWLALFSVDDIALAKENIMDEEGRMYAYLCGDRAAGVERLHALAPVLKPWLGAERFALYEDWTGRIKAEPYQHTLVRTQELDWMGEQGELERELREAFEDLEHARRTGELRLGSALRNLISVPPYERLDQVEGFRLAGTANTSEDWPPRLTPQPCADSQPEPPKKNSKWLFWLR